MNNMEKMDIPYITPLTMNKYDGRGCYKFSSYLLERNCIDNLVVPSSYKRKDLIKGLMKI